MPQHTRMTITRHPKTTPLKVQTNFHDAFKDSRRHRRHFKLSVTALAALSVTKP